MGKNYNNNIVRQSNDMVVYAKFDLTLLENKLLRLLASCVSYDDEDFKEYKFNTVDLIKLFGCERKSIHKQLYKMSSSLMSKHITLYKDIKNWSKYHLIRTCSYNNGVLTLKIDDEMKSFFLELKEYTSYKLKHVLLFKNKYSFKLYEYFKKYIGINKKEISIKELKLLLSIEEIYKQYGHLKERVIKPAIKEINLLTDLLVKYEEIKEGRTITAILFYIKYNDIEYEIAKNSKEYKDVDILIDLFSSLYGIKLNKNLTIDLVKQKGFDVVKECITEIKNHVKEISPQIFYDFTLKYNTAFGYTPIKKYNNIQNKKPIQSTNYEQRQYDDEFFDSLYCNLDKKQIQKIKNEGE